MNEELDFGAMRQSLRCDADLQEIGQNVVLPRRNGWFSRHKNGLSGVACLAAALVLLVSIVGRMRLHPLSADELFVGFAATVIALYCLLKGVFTLVFQAKTNAFDVSVHQFMIADAYNRLYFVYERMVWLWVLLPTLLAVVPEVFGMTGATRIVYAFAALAAFIVLLLAFSWLLARKRKRLKREIEQLKQLNN